MYKSVIAAALFAFGIAGGQSAQGPQSALRFKEEHMTLEYSPANGIASVVVEAETEESVGNVQVSLPGGSSSFKLRAENGRRLALSAFKLESQESDLATILDAYPEGTYELRGRTLAGLSVTGSAEFSHVLPAAPVLLYPRDGARGIPTTGLTVTWAADGGAVAYRIVLEQGENDGLTAQVSGGSNSLHVPDEVLAPASDYHLEIAAIGPDGNRTVAEVSFTTE
jgi:hypothetical protein